MLALVDTNTNKIISLSNDESIIEEWPMILDEHEDIVKVSKCWQEGDNLKVIAGENNILYTLENFFKP